MVDTAMDDSPRRQPDWGMRALIDACLLRNLAVVRADPRNAGVPRAADPATVHAGAAGSGHRRQPLNVGTYAGFCTGLLPPSKYHRDHELRRVRHA